MQILLTDRFQKDVSSLNPSEKNELFQVMVDLPKAVQNIHSHSGMGLRKIHSSGIFEARLGLQLRVAFTFEKQTLVLHRVGNHDEIKRYLKNL